MPEFAIHNPATPYGLSYIRAMHRRFGWRAICFYSKQTRHPGRMPELRDPAMVAASYHVPPDALPAFAHHLRTHHDVRAVVPTTEIDVAKISQLATLLELDWAQPDVLARFRDKYALKAHLARTDPGLRLNIAERVTSAAHALEIAHRHRLRRFVIKPNNGFANVGVGFFEMPTPQALMAEHFDRSPQRDWLLEDYLEGPEYHCNGQVDGTGNISIIDIGLTHMHEIPGIGPICRRTDLIPTTDPHFGPITDYTRRMITASGLRRCPFHAEMRYTQDGPILLECAARLIGSNHAEACNDAHGQKFNVFDLAGHYFGAAADYGDLGLDWAHYNANVIVKFRGVCDQATRVYSTSGFDRVPQMPEFLRWESKPAFGDVLPQTNSLISSPWALFMRAKTMADADALEATLRTQLRWNEQPSTWQQRLRLAINPTKRALRRGLAELRSDRLARVPRLPRSL